MRMEARHYSFGRFDIDVATREIRDGGALVDVPARAFDCLVYLIEHRDRAVGRDELIAAVWGRADVSEALLNHTILRIRRAIGGDGAKAIRTVPRFGYRWVGAIGEADGDPVEEHRIASESAAEPMRPAPARTPRFGLAAALAFAAAAAIAGIALGYRHVAVAPATVGKASAPDIAALPALVLPAKIDAPEDWAWLRFGLMDLVANRLRSGALKTVPSESVVAMLKQRAAADGDALLADPSLAAVAALRVLPRVRLDRDRWTVTLDASGAQRRFSVEASSADPIAAAREASNRLLGRLGHAPGTSAADASPALEELLQRSGAAMLADQLDAARSLIDGAAAELRNAPPVQQRLAQIELRAGDYAAVERRLLALLDRVPAARDPALRARALITLASSYVRRDEFDKADEAYTEAIALRGGAEDPEALGIAHLGRGIVLAERDAFDEAIAELGRARIELETAGDPLGLAQVDVNLGDFEAMRHRPSDALAMLESAARRFEQLGAREGRLHALIGVAAAERELLDPAAALATTARFWPAETQTSNPRMRWSATLARAEALVASGSLDAASALIDRIRADSDPDRDAAVRAASEAVAASIAMRRGDAAAAARLAETASTPALRDSDKARYARTLLLAAGAWQAAGDSAKGAAAAVRLHDFAAASHDDGVSLAATLADAHRAWADGRRDAAVQAFAAAMHAAERLGVPEDLVAAGAAYADALIGVGHLDEARAIAGRIAPWSERDPRAAWTGVRLFRALGREDAERNARLVAVRLTGEGRLPADLSIDAAAAAR